MNDNNLVSIDDDSLEQVAGGFGFLGALIIKPIALVTGLVSALLGGHGHGHNDCAPPPPPSCRPRKGC